jgi:hypothetical protein
MSPIHLRWTAGERLLKGALRRAGALRPRVHDRRAASRSGGRIPAMLICIQRKGTVKREKRGKRERFWRTS